MKLIKNSKSHSKKIKLQDYIPFNSIEEALDYYKQKYILYKSKYDYINNENNKLLKERNKLLIQIFLLKNNKKNFKYKGIINTYNNNIINNIKITLIILIQKKKQKI